MKRTVIIFLESAMQVVFSLPRFRAMNAFKVPFLKLFGAEVGRRCTFYSGIWIMPIRGLKLGDDVDLARGVLITTGGSVSIGSRTLVGYGARILSSNHKVGPNGVFGAGHIHEAVRIDDDVWIGAGVTVLPGVHIGARAIVAAGAVVTSDVPPGTLVAGVPARVLRTVHQDVDD